MPHPLAQLTHKSLAILEMIAGGIPCEQILADHPALTSADISHAAQEALRLLLLTPDPPDAPAAPAKPCTLADKRERHPRAYEK